MVKQDRRKFIRNSILGIGGGAVLGRQILTGEGDNSNRNHTDPKPERMKFRKLGKTGIQMPVIGMGCNSMNENLVRAALERGINYFDTGHYYYKGKNELMFGRVLKPVKRDSFLISTKVLMPGEDHFKGRIDRQHINRFVEKFEISLKRLQLEYVDMFLLHNVGSRQPVLYEPMLEVMEKLKKSGKTRLVGVSTHINEPEVIEAAVDSNVYDLVMTALNFRQPHRSRMISALDKAETSGLGIIAMKVMAGAFWDSERKEAIDNRAALKWVLQHRQVHSALMGMMTFDQLESNLSVLGDQSMKPDDFKALKMGNETGGLYCAQCGRCRAQCRQQNHIPDMMRAYMYAFGYGMPLKAKETLNQLKRQKKSCQNCQSCGINNCPMNFDIRGKLAQLDGLAQVPDRFLV